MFSPLVSLNSLSLRIDRACLLIVDKLDLFCGEHYCVVGGNGAGKTMLARVLSGIQRVTSDSLSVSEGFEPRRDVHWVSFEEQQRIWERENRHDISEFESRAIDVGTIVTVMIRDSRSENCQDDELFHSLVSSLNLGDLLDRGIRYLSSGQIRRVLIARALYASHGDHAQVIILDDPLASIDLDSQALIRGVLARHRPRVSIIIELCRRPQDRLEGATRIVVMEATQSTQGRELALIAHGEVAAMESTEAYRRFSEHKQPNTDALEMLLRKLADEEVLDDDIEKPLLELRGVSANYGEKVILSDVNWVMDSKDNILIAGPNGCGKSTLLALIDGDSHKGYGQELWLFGRRKGSGETLWETKRQFGVVSNELHNRYLKGWRAGEVVVSGFFDSEGLYDTPSAQQLDLAKQWLAALGQADIAGHAYASLSFGQQRLVLLARAMVKSPKILVLDEACVGLDNDYLEIVLRSVDRIVENTSTRLLFVSHSADEMPRCINRKLGFRKLPDGSHTLVEDKDGLVR